MTLKYSDEEILDNIEKCFTLAQNEGKHLEDLNLESLHSLVISTNWLLTLRNEVDL